MVHELTAVKSDNFNWELGWMATVTREAIREFCGKARFAKQVSQQETGSSSGAFLIFGL
jgi:hypothetical protein